MRSIRRSMSIYLSALLVITLLTVGLVIYRVTEGAFKARQEDGEKLIQAQYEERCRDERNRTDQALLNQARLLYGLMTEHSTTRFPVELTNFRLLNEWAPGLFVSNPLGRAAWAANANNPITRDSVARIYFSNLLLPAEDIQRISEASWGPDAKFKLSDKVLNALRTENMPESILVKLQALKDREVSQDELVKEISEDLPADEKERWKNVIINHAWIDYQQINGVRGSEWHSESLAGHKLPFDPKE